MPNPYHLPPLITPSGALYLRTSVRGHDHKTRSQISAYRVSLIASFADLINLYLYILNCIFFAEACSCIVISGLLLIHRRVVVCLIPLAVRERPHYIYTKLLLFCAEVSRRVIGLWDASTLIKWTRQRGLSLILAHINQHSKAISVQIWEGGKRTLLISMQRMWLRVTSARCEYAFEGKFNNHKSGIFIVIRVMIFVWVFTGASVSCMNQWTGWYASLYAKDNGGEEVNAVRTEWYGQCPLWMAWSFGVGFDDRLDKQFAVCFRNVLLSFYWYVCEHNRNCCLSLWGVYSWWRLFFLGLNCFKFIVKIFKKYQIPINFHVV